MTDFLLYQVALFVRLTRVRAAEALVMGSGDINLFAILELAQRDLRYAQGRLL